MHFKIDEQQRKKSDGKKVKNIDRERGSVQYPIALPPLLRQALPTLSRKLTAEHS